MPREVDDIIAALQAMNEEERQGLLLRLAQMDDDVLEDLEDIADVLRAEREPSRPFEEFVDELSSENNV